MYHFTLRTVHTLKVIDWSAPLSHIMLTGFLAQTLCFLGLNSIGGMSNGMRWRWLIYLPLVLLSRWMGSNGIHIEFPIGEMSFGVVRWFVELISKTLLSGLRVSSCLLAPCWPPLPVENWSSGWCLVHFTLSLS
ncbi:hypothetical protein FXO38_03429 [Capsicum annuum]|nr:hypothetical protein FXO38_03429 [Capsicum annuum]